MIREETFIKCPSNPRAHKSGPLKGLVLASDHGECKKHGKVSKEKAGRLADMLRVQQKGTHFELEHPSGQRDAILRPAPASAKMRIIHGNH